ncbi:MAG: bifunctional molybdenum cofactor biosynthesis protein MoaC/MoaB [Deltaproteobacteria bacterium]|nr:bifunctional molybdenum cofactor biosynthesis protein MoaC/MoaB [Deltaproteobacteria bacterium]
MKSISHKIETLRTATAEAWVLGPAPVLEALLRGDTPKGNAVDVARIAGMLAAKRTWELIPHCHPIPLDQVLVEIAAVEGKLRVEARVTAIWRTGMEMEALTAATIAALTLYDIGKAMDASLEISGVRLVEKTGGKSDYQERIPESLRVAVLVTSDATHAGKREDKSGAYIQKRLRAFSLTPQTFLVLPDDQAAIAATLRQWADEAYDLVLTTGGTGLGPRDVTVEATRSVIEREIPGIAEAMRAHGQRRTPYAMLSRGLIGVRGKTVIANLPGSSRGVAESMDAIFPALFHLYPMMRGGGH